MERMSLLKNLRPNPLQLQLQGSSPLLSLWVCLALLPLIGCHGSGDAIPNINNAAAFLEDDAVVRGPGMVTPRYGHTATVLGDGTVLVAGGTDERHLTSLDTAEVFDQGAALLS